MSSAILNEPPLSLPDERGIARDLQSFLSASGVPAIGVDISVGEHRLNLAAGTRRIGARQPLNGHSRFRISCLTKVFGSLVCLKLAQAGVLDIDAPIGAFLPELGVAEGSKGARIRVRHLLMHTAGYRGMNALEGNIWVQWPWETCLAFLQSTPQLFAPGTVFNESHFDHVLLGKILHQITGRGIPELLREHIFEPLGIEAGTAAQDMDLPELYVHGHKFSFQDGRLEEAENPGAKESELWTSSLSDITLTVRDIATIGRTFLSAQVASSGYARQEIFFPAMFGAGLDTNWRPRGFSPACALFAGGRAGYLAVSEGQNCALVIDPEHDICVALGLNAAAVKVRVALLNCIFARIGGATAQDARDFLAPPPAVVDFDAFLKPFRPRQLQGRYVGCFKDDMLVSATPNRIDIRMGKGTQLALVRSQDNRLGMMARAAVPIGFFSNPVSGEPVIMLGMYAFKKVA